MLSKKFFFLISLISLLAPSASLADECDDNDCPKPEPKVNVGSLGFGASINNDSEKGTRSSGQAKLRYRGISVEHGDFFDDDSGARRWVGFVEGDLSYNMIGRTDDKITTGLEGRAAVGLGGTFKEPGQRGVDFYALATARIEGAVHYNRPIESSFGGIVSPETGLLIQINDDVALMASPTVGVGQFTQGLKSIPRRGEYGEVIAANRATGWLHLGGRARMVIRDKAYVAVEYLHSPNTGGTGEDKRFLLDQLGLTADVKINDKWSTGTDAKLLLWEDPTAVEDSEATSAQVGVHVGRVF